MPKPRRRPRSSVPTRAFDADDYPLVETPEPRPFGEGVSGDPPHLGPHPQRA